MKSNDPPHTGLAGKKVQNSVHHPNVSTRIIRERERERECVYM
jgi:hypothetical protein